MNAKLVSLDSQSPSVFYILSVRDPGESMLYTQLQCFMFSSEKSIYLLLTICMYMFTYKHMYLKKFCVARILVFIFPLLLFRKKIRVFYMQLLVLKTE